jgi:hypothetical protein
MSTQPPPSDEPPLSAYEGGPLGAGIDWADPNSPIAPLYFSTGGVIAVAVLGLAFFVLSAVPLRHTDFWVHLKYGEWIAAHRALPGHEPLSAFTDKQPRMFDAMWLTQVGYHKLFRAGEALGGSDPARRFAGAIEVVRLAHLLAALAAVGLVGLACRRVADSVPWAILGMLFVLVIEPTPLTWQRPQTFALVCFAAVLLALSRPVPTRRAVVWLPALMVLWANLHGSFVMSFGLIGAALLARVLDLGRAEGAPAVVRDTAARRLLLAFLLGAGAVAVLNPYGPGLYLDVVRFGENPNLRTLAEWRPLDFSQPRGGHLAYLVTIVFLLVTQLVSPRPIGTFPLLLLLTLGVWPLIQQRAMAWWIPVVPWIAAPHWVAAAERWGLAAPGGPPDFRKTALSVLLVVLAVIASPASTWLKTGHPRPVQTAVHAGTPVDVAAVLAGRTPQDAKRVERLAAEAARWGGPYKGRIFTSEVQGEYLLWALPPEAEVMMFTHAQLFTPEYWNECLTVKDGGPGWWEILDRYRVGLIVVETDFHPNLCAELRKSERWSVVVDEAEGHARDPFTRLFVAVRKPVYRGGPTP